jgi:hypothetical protein
LRKEAGVTAAADSLPLSLLGWTLGCVGVWSGLFCTGSFLYGRTATGFALLTVFAACAIGLAWLVPRLWSGGASK